jgi:NAD-dependent SIR2 family protein deacetylase
MRLTWPSRSWRSAADSGLVTQNVDGLHQQAGSAAVTGCTAAYMVVCLDCRASHTRRLIQDMLEHDNPQLLGATATPAPDGDALLEPSRLATFHLPACPRCGGTCSRTWCSLAMACPPPAPPRPNARWEASALLVVGSSVMVYSSFRLCRMAAGDGQAVAAINLGKNGPTICWRSRRKRRRRTSCQQSRPCWADPGSALRRSRYTVGLTRRIHAGTVE